MITTNPIKRIFDRDITEEVHNAFTRYSLGEFVKEPFLVKAGKGQLTVNTGFEYLSFLHEFLAENLKGEVEISGVIETVKDLASAFRKLGLKFEEENRFGKPGKRYLLPPQKVKAEVYKKLVAEMRGEYLLFNVNFSGGLLKVRSKNTPKLGSPTNNFVIVKIPVDLFSAFKADYLFDLDQKEFKNVTIEQTYYIEDIEIDAQLLAKDAHLARKRALRKGEISRKITVDEKVVKDYRIKFKV